MGTCLQVESPRLDLSRDEVLIISALDKSASYWNKKLQLACVADDYDTKERVISYIKLMKKSDWQINLFDNLEQAMAWCQAS